MKQLTVAVIDDEQMIIEGFLRLVQWEMLHCEVVATAYDGLDGEAMIRRFRPDIVVTDINMSVVNGLDMIKRVSVECPDTQFIIISGYDDFAYTREALRLRVYDYLLKPVDFRQFERLIEALRRECFPEKPDEQSLIDRMTDYIDKNYAQPLSLRALASRFYMTPAYFSQYFKKKRGVNYYAYLIDVRMRNARRLLAETDFPIAEIACGVGVDDYRTFTKLFHKEIGVSPSEYRRRLFAESTDIDEQNE